MAGTAGVKSEDRSPRRQNLDPAPTRPVMMVARKSGGGLNWSHSNSARRKILRHRKINATADGEAVEDWLLALKPLAGWREKHGSRRVQVPMVPDVYSIARQYWRNVRVRQTNRKADEAVGKKIADHPAALEPERGEIFAHHCAVAADVDTVGIAGGIA